jgi:hypothetical protein
MTFTSLRDLSLAAILFSDAPLTEDIPEEAKPVLSMLAQDIISKFQNWAAAKPGWKGTLAQHMIQTASTLHDNAAERLLFIMERLRAQLRNHPRRNKILDEAKNKEIVPRIIHLITHSVDQLDFSEDYRRAFRDIRAQLHDIPFRVDLVPSAAFGINYQEWSRIIRNLRSENEAAIFLIAAIESGHTEIVKMIKSIHPQIFESFMRRAIYIAANRDRRLFFDYLFSDKYTHVYSPFIFENLICPPGYVDLSRMALENFPSGYFSSDQIGKALSQTIDHFHMHHIPEFLSFLLKSHGAVLNNEHIEKQIIKGLKVNEKIETSLAMSFVNMLLFHRGHALPAVAFQRIFQEIRDDELTMRLFCKLILSDHREILNRLPPTLKKKINATTTCCVIL